MMDLIIRYIKEQIKLIIPNLSDDAKESMRKIINPDIPDYEIYGLKVSDINSIVKTVRKKYPCSLTDPSAIFKTLIKYDIEEFKFAAFLYLNQFKREFDKLIVDLIKNKYASHCHTWSICDSTCVRLIGPFLARKTTNIPIMPIIDDWAGSENIWIKRASMVALLKIIMLRKDFDEYDVFSLIENMNEFSQQGYIAKAMGWLLKICSKFKPNLIYEYLKCNSGSLSRVILRYASEKLPIEQRQTILTK
jgi:3-methyladenine DNA glycosylase AlkD